jgi:hypothetical protein
MPRFSTEVVDRLCDVREIEVETTRASGEKRRTIIWVVVDGSDVFVRSEYGARGWWYRDICARPEAVIQPRTGDRTPLAVRAVRADDPESIERVSAAIRTKYRPSSAIRIMTSGDALPATLRLEPA